MPITVVTGVPRSGKSYFSVYKIHEIYKNELISFKKKHKYIHWFLYYWYSFFPPAPKEVFTWTYTNINEFKFDLYPQTKPLIYKELYTKLSRLHRFHVDRCATDTELVEKAKELDLYDVYIVWDECHHNLYGKEDEVITWWLTYHGHLHQEVHLITQNPSLIPTGYTKLGEYFYKVGSASKSLSKNSFRIGSYESAGFHKNGRSKVEIILPFKDEVFNLYKSGKPQKRKAILKKYAFIIPILVLLVVYLFSSFNDSFAADINEPIPVSSKSEIVVDDLQLYIEPIDKNSTVERVEIDYDKDMLIQFTCFGDECYFNEKVFPISFLKFYIENYPPKYYDIDSLINGYAKYTMIVDKKVELFISPAIKTSKRGDNAKNTNPVPNIF